MVGEMHVMKVHAACGIIMYLMAVYSIREFQKIVQTQQCAVG